MVLINNLTIDEINAALLHLQRSQGEIVGGNKGNTINNISVTQQGGGGYTPDFSSAIKNLEKRVDTLDVKTEQNQQNIAGQSKINVTQKDQISDLYNLVNNLRSSQITELFFDEDTRVLTLATTDARYDVPLPSEEVSLTFDSTSNKLVFSMGEQTKEVTLPYINASEKGAANGVAELDATGRVPYSQLPESAMEFKGEWNADTNTPELKDGHGTNGDFYICNVGGTANFGTSENPRTITFYVNDRVIYQGNVAQWKRLPASEVRTVNGQSGDVVLNGTNVKYSDANNSPTLKDKIDSVETKAETQSNWTQSDTSAIDYIKNKPNLATVATSGSYNDLSNKPTIPAAQIQSDWTQTDSTKKDFIKNKIPIWITSGSADDNMSPIDSVTDGSMRPVTSNAVADIMSSLPTDAVLHYSFDEVPDYPDGTAVYKKLKFETADEWAVFQCTKSIQNNKLKLVSNGTYAYFNILNNSFTSSLLTNKIIIIRVEADNLSNVVLQDNGGSYTVHTLQKTKVGSNEYIFMGLIPTVSYNQLITFRFNSTSANNVALVEAIYIGDGSYSTPIIDNANGQNNATNNGGIAVQGVSGKAVSFLGSSYFEGNLPWAPWIKQSFSMCCWIRNWDKINKLPLVNNWTEYALNSFALWIEAGNLSIELDVPNNTGIQRLNVVKTTIDLTALSEFFIAITCNGANTKIYINGESVQINSSASTTISEERKTKTYFQVGRYRGQNNYVYGKADIDDLQIFNQILSEQEVQALYLNKANTPKYYSWADWRLSQIS